MPIFCDMTCPEADWPKDDALDGSNSCRTFLAVHCHKYDRVNSKNGPCLDISLGEEHAVKKDSPVSNNKTDKKKTGKKKK